MLEIKKGMKVKLISDYAKEQLKFYNPDSWVLDHESIVPDKWFLKIDNTLVSLVSMESFEIGNDFQLCVEITERQKAQIKHYLDQFTNLANSHLDKGNEKIAEYWKGQVMGISKVVNILGLDIDNKYFLNQLY